VSLVLVFLFTLQGEDIPGNKMDSNNLATLFAPNILHSMKTAEGAAAPGALYNHSAHIFRQIK
jgi:hypothetical protein